jgi:hypothetical protein
MSKRKVVRVNHLAPRYQCTCFFPFKVSLKRFTNSCEKRDTDSNLIKSRIHNTIHERNQCQDEYLIKETQPCCGHLHESISFNEIIIISIVQP